MGGGGKFILFRKSNINNIKRGSGGKVTKVRACGALAAGRGLLTNTNQKYVSPAKLQISLHL